MIVFLVKSIDSRGTCLLLGSGLVMLNWIRAYFASGGLDNFSVDLFLDRSFGDGILLLFDKVLFC